MTKTITNFITNPKATDSILNKNTSHKGTIANINPITNTNTNIDNNSSNISNSKSNTKTNTITNRNTMTNRYIDENIFKITNNDTNNNISNDKNISNIDDTCLYELIDKTLTRDLGSDGYMKSKYMKDNNVKTNSKKDKKLNAEMDKIMKDMLRYSNYKSYKDIKKI